MIKRLLSKSLITLAATGLLLSVTSLPALATIVVFETSHGDIEVNLFDKSTPKTVENFLSYVNDGSYANTVIHRSIPNFIIQGGGFTFEGEFPLVKTATKVPVVNEPVWSNQRGTIAMAKLGNDPDSATNQWFLNLGNNSANLDNQNSGFTVFGQVSTEGMVIIDEMVTLNTCTEVIMPDYDCSANLIPGTENFITIYSVIISDTAIDTAFDLNPIKNTANSDDGGSLNYVGLFILFMAGLRKLKTVNL
jgi:peptidyl-prolyl cis-trans isomerase A (cyclophilin A)